MRKKKIRIAVVLGILLFCTAHAGYGYWTDRIQVREEAALIWPVELEIEEESGETGEEAEKETEEEKEEERLPQEPES